jgi:hypothetical protein
MSQTPHTDWRHRAILQGIARRAMIERGFIDFRRVDAKGAGTWTTPSHS